MDLTTPPSPWQKFWICSVADLRVNRKCSEFVLFCTLFFNVHLLCTHTCANKLFCSSIYYPDYVHSPLLASKKYLRDALFFQKMICDTRYFSKKMFWKCNFSKCSAVALLPCYRKSVMGSIYWYYCRCICKLWRRRKYSIGICLKNRRCKFHNHYIASKWQSQNYGWQKIM